MAQRILVFEKDTNFLRELQTGFERYGASVEVVQDPDSVVANAKSSSTALVLVSVDAMSAPGEAFLVCKRFKSDDELSRVPFVIMGGPQHADSFGTHRKLKRRADEYVELPIKFDALVGMLKPLVPLQESSTNGAAKDDDDMNLNVDADIEAFADSAFDDLVLDEQKHAEPPKAAEPSFVPKAAPVPMPPAMTRPAAPASALVPPVPAAAAPSAAQTEELAKLKKQIDELTQRAKGAEDRAQANEDKLKGTEDRSKSADDRVKAAEDRARNAEERVKFAEDRAQEAEKRAKEVRASLVPPSPATGVSSRDYLDLREQLNRKEKELLSLRDEVTTRDRQLLDASDRALDLERAQAEVQDKLAISERELDDAQARIKSFEVDKEAVGKRLEDLKSRLARADDKGKKLEDELDTIKSSHAREVSELKTGHQARLSEIENAVGAEVARMRADHAMQMENATQQAERELSEQKSAHANELSATKSAHANELSAIKSAHSNELSSMRAVHTSLLDDERSNFAREKQEMQAGHEAASARARAEAAAEQERVLDQASRAHRAELEQKLADADLARNAALEGQKRELEAKHAGAQKEIEDRHGRELAVLGRKLSEADGKNASLTQKLDETERAKAELESTSRARVAGLEGDLKERTEQRDMAQNELSAARASISQLERTEADNVQRIGRLEAQLSLANDRLRRAEAKIRQDQELLDRVRKALGIGIGLLEQQKQNGLEEA
jgi:chromosome segregation ATPase/DNA-binding response OmpR family regulator